MSGHEDTGEFNRRASDTMLRRGNFNHVYSPGRIRMPYELSLLLPRYANESPFKWWMAPAMIVILPVGFLWIVGKRLFTGRVVR